MPSMSVSRYLELVVVSSCLMFRIRFGDSSKGAMSEGLVWNSARSMMRLLVASRVGLSVEIVSQASNQGDGHGHETKPRTKNWQAQSGQQRRC